MKSTINKILVLLILLLLYYVIFSGILKGTEEAVTAAGVSKMTPYLNPSPGGDKDFINCIFNDGWDTTIPGWIENHLNAGMYSDSLHFNTVQLYDRINGDINGTPYYGEFLPDLTGTQITHTNNLLSLTNNKNLKLLYERCKISKLCYAQRLVYEVGTGSTSINDGFCYTSGGGEYTTDSGRTVRHGTDPVQQYPNGYWLSTGIYENLQHSDLYNFNLQLADSGTWYMKPMMRIDSSIIDNYPDKPVVRIVVNNFRGDTIKNVVIKASDFGQFNGQEYLYNGSYIEAFYFTPGTNLEISGSDTLDNGLGKGIRAYRERYHEWPTYCHIDFKVYWPGEVEVWFDKMTVDDEYGNRLFSGIDNPKIEDEVSHFADNSGLYSFFADELVYSQLEACRYVDSVMKYYNANARLHIAGTNYLNTLGLKDNTKGFSLIFQKVHPYSYNPDAHEFCGPLPYQFINADPRFPEVWKSTSNADYNRYVQEHCFGDKNTISDEYTYWTTNNRYLPAPHGSFVYVVNLAREQIDDYSPSTKLIMQPQIQMFAYTVNDTFWGGREPTNEEIQAQAMISIAHGADGICWFIYNTAVWPVAPGSQDSCFMFGLLNRWQDGNGPRHSNFYGQDKWNYVRDMNIKIENWKPTLDNINWQAGYSVHSEYNTGAFTNRVLYDIQSIDPHKSGANPCVHDSIQDNFGNEWLDCPEERYWEIGYFNDPDASSVKYFLMVNRRCVPEAGGLAGDDRVLRFKPNPAQLTEAVNWKISDVGDLRRAFFFSRNYQGYVDIGSDSTQMGWFEPGEGRLFKLEPVPQSGGNLVADEYIPSGQTFTCQDTVWTNGYNLTIEDGVTIHFSDSAKFVVEGGTFQLGTPDYQGPLSIEMGGETGAWKGFEFVEANVKIYNTDFSGLANDSISMLTMIDCPLIDIRNNTFSLGTGNNKGAMDIAYSGSYASGVTDNVYIGSNTFGNSSTALPYVKIMAYSGITIPVIIEENGFTGSSTALFLSNIQGGAVKSNTFTGFSSSLTALSSSLDIYNNTISSTGTYGINALSGTELKMSYAGGLLVGGRNNITNSDSSSSNIYLEDSYFLMDEGENIFDVGYDGWHLYGWFPESYSGAYEEIENCFKVNSTVVDPPVEYVTLGEQGYQITEFIFDPYLTGCTQGGEGDMMVINLGNDIYDTLMYEGQGQGGAAPPNLPKGEAFVIPPKTVYDSVCIQTRYRNYANVKSLCLYLLNTYPDSVQSLGALSKLYLAVSKTDTTTQGITNLKTLYENLILNHSNNISLVKRCNYYVQKCKVLLHQYSSALAGFQQIINNNPASYEGLVARWDYMATSLLLQGQGGSEKGDPLFHLPLAKGETEWGSEYGDDDKSPFTREERKQIKQAVNTALEVSKYTEKKREKVLTELSTRGDENATRQLKVLKSLEQTVKTEKPKSISEHLKIVSGDIQKVFVNPNKGKNTNTTFIPTAFNLSQNYPNPFNPTTKLSYDIPKNSMVKIIIYDILGREVMKLVNNEFKQPGRYVVEFNGTNFASGVYFYRIEAGNFVEAKKMVLVK